MMPPKTPRTPQTPSKVITTVEWKNCSNCQSIFYARDKHEATCSSVAAKQFWSLESNGLIHERQLYGFVQDAPCNECLTFQMKVEKSNLILVSVAAMQVCGIEIGSHVMVEIPGTPPITSIFVAWPCPHLHPTSIHINNDVLKLLTADTKPTTTKVLKVTSIDNISVAYSIHLQICTENLTVDVCQLPAAFLLQFEGHIVSKGISLVTKFYGQKLKIVVNSVVPDRKFHTKTDVEKLEEDLKLMSVEESSETQKYFLVLSSSKVHITNLPGKLPEESKSSSVQLADFGGNRDIVKEILNTCSSVFNLNPSKGNVPRGMLLHGPSGTGKSLLVKAMASHFNVPLITIVGPELFSKFYGETESRLRAKFDEALKSETCIILMDEIDSLCPNRDASSSSHSDQERRVVATVLTMMDSIPLESQVIIMAASSRPDALDPALRRPGRLDREFEIRAPTMAERKEILVALLRKVPHLLNEEEIKQVANVTPGFVGADISLLCREASLISVKRNISSSENAGTDDKAIAASAFITYEDVKQALHLVKPSAMREVLVEVPNVRWTDVGGQTELKKKLRQAVEWPLRHPEAFRRLGVEPPRGLLMFGPPGCSKTMIAKALATESGLNFIAVKGPELFNKYVGESERAVREVFRRARQVAPSIVFLDELDALGSARGSGSSSAGVGDRVLAQLLTEMDGIEALKDVTVVAATNRPDMIDKALLRPGRLDRIVYVPLPDEETRREILNLRLKSMPYDQEEVHMDWLVASTDGYSGAEVSAVCNEAALRAMEEGFDVPQVGLRHFEYALSIVVPRITGETITFYEDYVKKSGMHAI